MSGPLVPGGPGAPPPPPPPPSAPERDATGMKCTYYLLYYTALQYRMRPADVRIHT